MSTLTTYSTTTESYSHNNKAIKVGKEEVKLSLFANDIILYIEHYKDSMKNKLLKIISECIKVVGYKVNMQKYEFLCTNDKIAEIVCEILYLLFNSQ